MVKFISYLEIEKEADAFLARHNAKGTIPVPIDEIIEFDLNISIITKKELFSRESIDAFLTSDMEELHIDHDYYMDETNRGRFTLAHEVGHFILHKQYVTAVNSLEQWKEVMLGEGTGRDYLETQADNFAGCVLMPREQILKEFGAQKEKTRKTFEQQGLQMPEDEVLIPFVANSIARVFQVSQKATQIRLERIFRNPIN